MCSKPSTSKCGSTDCAHLGRQAEHLEPVAAVRLERVRHRALERAPGERAVGRPAAGCGRPCARRPGRNGASARPATSAIGVASRCGHGVRDGRAAPRYARYDAVDLPAARRPHGSGTAAARRRRAGGARHARTSGPRCSTSVQQRRRGRRGSGERRSLRGVEPRTACGRAGQVRRLALHLHEPVHRGDAVSTSMIQSTGTRMLNASPMPSSTNRSARSMSPPARRARAPRPGPARRR